MNVIFSFKTQSCNIFFILEAASSFVRIPHNIGDRPTFVVVQVMTSDGYIFEAEGMEQNILLM